MNPKLSIIMPVVDVPHGSGRPYFGLKYSIESCLRSKGNFELLIGADGEQPKIRELVESFKDDRIRYFEYPYTGNWGNTQRNRLIKEATGTHVTYLDQDDAMINGAIELVLENAELFPDRPTMYQIITHHGHVKWTPSKTGVNFFPITEDQIPGDNALLPNEEPHTITRYVDCVMCVLPIEGVKYEWAPEENYNADWIFLIRTLNGFKRAGKKMLFIPFVFKATRPLVRQMIEDGLMAMAPEDRADFQ